MMICFQQHTSCLSEVLSSKHDETVGSFTRKKKDISHQMNLLTVQLSATHVLLSLRVSRIVGGLSNDCLKVNLRGAEGREMVGQKWIGGEE